MKTKNWQVLLDEASDAESVAAVCDQFLGTWTDAERAGIPPACQPPGALDPDEIGRYAIRLIEEVGVGNRATKPLLYAMSTFFTKAALRIAEFEEPLAPPPPSMHRGSGSSGVA